MNRQKQPRLLVSACLCGHPCRYDGGQFDIPALQALEASGEAVAFCPECAGGLPTPRIPCEICGDRVISREGQDCTAAYRRGAEAALAMCRRLGLTAAILKDGSPSCGVTRIYDGSHTGQCIPGQGITAARLAENGIALFSEENWTAVFSSETDRKD